MGKSTILAKQKTSKMSLHNSTVIENQIWTNLLIGWSKLSKDG